MLEVKSTSQAFQSTQSPVMEITYWDTPFTVLENGVASGGIRLDVINPKATWSLKEYLSATEDTDISSSFLTQGRVALEDGRVPSVQDYWAGGSPAHYGGDTNGIVGLHYYGELRSALGREWFDATEIPEWHLAVAGSGRVRIDKHVDGVVTTIFNEQLTEIAFLGNDDENPAGFRFSTTINDLEASSTHSLHIYYAQDETDPWGGLVIKAVRGVAPVITSIEPSVARAAQLSAREAPVLGAGLIDDGMISRTERTTLESVANITVSRRVGSSPTATFELPLINMAKSDGVGWEYKKPTYSNGVPITASKLRYWDGTWTTATPSPAFEIKRQRLVRIKTGFSGEALTTVFVGLVDDFDSMSEGRAMVTCRGFESRLLERHDKNYPDKISYMGRGYRKILGTTEPAYDTPAFDNWPIEYAVSELMVRSGIDPSRLEKTLFISRYDATSIAAEIGGEIFKKFRGRMFRDVVAGKSKLLKLERQVHYGNNGILFNEDTPHDDEYIFKPENTLEIWKRCLDLTDRYGYDLRFDEEGDVWLQPRNNPHAVYNINDDDVISGSLTIDVHPSAYQGNYYISTGTVTLRKEVTGARIDVSLPRAQSLASVTVNVYRKRPGVTTPDVGDLVKTVELFPASAGVSEPVFFYDFRSTTDGTNATVSTVYSGEFDNYFVEFVGSTSGTRYFDCVFTYHTDPSVSKLPISLDTTKNALSINTQSSMEEMRNAVTVVGKRKATITDSEKLDTNPNNPNAEFVVSRAIDVNSIANPDAPNYVGYPRETLIYSADITDQDFAEYLSRVMIFRYRLPLPSAPIKHTLLPFVQLRDAINAHESRYKTITSEQVLYVTGYTHRVSLREATTDIETTAFPEFPAYEPRQDIDIDQPEFGGIPVLNVDVNYKSVTNTFRRNIPAPSDTYKPYYQHSNVDIIERNGVNITSGGTVSMAGYAWPPVPGTLFFTPDKNIVAGGATQVTFSEQEKVPAGSEFPSISLPNVISITKVWVRSFTVPLGGGGLLVGDFKEITGDPQFHFAKFYYQLIGTNVVVRRLAYNSVIPNTTLWQVKVEWKSGAFGTEKTSKTNNPYHHYFDINYSSPSIRFPYKEGDESAVYAIPSAELASSTIVYRRLGPVNQSTNLFENPYAITGSPFYDPYTSEIGNFVRVKFDALISGLYRISIRSLSGDYIAAWLTEPTADPEKSESHWQYMGAGADKEFVWDGVDNVGVWNIRQSHAYANAAHGEFELDQAPNIGKGFYVWNEETQAGAQRGNLALISGDRQDGVSHPITTQIGAPVFGVGTFGTWYVHIECKSDDLQEKYEDHKFDPVPNKQYNVPRVLKTKEQCSDTLTRLYKRETDSSSTVVRQAMVYTHLPRPSGVDLDIADWIGATPFTEATQEEIDDEGNWESTNDVDYDNRSTADADGTIQNDKPVRLRFVVQPRPGVMWVDKQDEVTVKLTRQVHLRAHIFDQFLVFDGNNFAGTPYQAVKVVSRRLVNDTHTLSYADTGYRKAKEFKGGDNAQGTEWIFKPSSFKKNFRGQDNEPLVFMDYLQLEELPKWDEERQIGSPRSRMQIAFMNYLFYLSAYTQDRSGRMMWAANRKFLDKSKLTQNDVSDWWDPASPGSPASASTFMVPLPDDPNRLHRRTVVTRQWTDEKVDDQDWRTREADRYGFSNSSTDIGYQLLRHKWHDHEPTATTLNTHLWSGFSGLARDYYSTWHYDRTTGNQKLSGASEPSLQWPDAANLRQMGALGAPAAIGTWTWENSPKWIPSITRDFHPYYLLPPMADSGYPHNRLRSNYFYAQVQSTAYDETNNKGDDVAEDDNWHSVTHEMNVVSSPGESATNKTRFWVGTKVAKGTDPTVDVLQTHIDYARQDEIVHYEDLRGMFSRGRRPMEQVIKVTPVQPYYVNAFDYDYFLVSPAYKTNGNYKNIAATFKKWFAMKFRTEYFWENSRWFPADKYGAEDLSALNITLLRRDGTVQTENTVSYDAGAWTGWKDDLTEGSNLQLQHRVTVDDDFVDWNAFQLGTIPTAVGPRLPETRDMIFHMVLVNERRALPV